MKKPKSNSDVVAESMMGMESESENKPEITLQSNEVSGIESIAVDAEVKITLTLKCIGKRKIKPTAEVVVPEGGVKPKEEVTAETDTESGYDMVFEILGSEVAGQEAEVE